MYLEVRERKLRRGKGDITKVKYLRIRASERRPGRKHPSKRTKLYLGRVRFRRPEGRGPSVPDRLDRARIWVKLANYLGSEMAGRFVETEQWEEYWQQQKRWLRGRRDQAPKEPDEPPYIRAEVLDQYKNVIMALQHALGRPSQGELDLTYGGFDENGDITKAEKERRQLEGVFGDRWLK